MFPLPRSGYSCSPLCSTVQGSAGQLQALACNIHTCASRTLLKSRSTADAIIDCIPGHLQKALQCLPILFED